MTTNKPINRIAKHLGNGDATSTACCKPQVERYQALVCELERIEREATARFNGQQVQEAETATQVNGSGPNDTKPTADGYAPIPVLIVDLDTLDAVLGWLH